MEPGGSLPCSQELAIRFYTELEGLVHIITQYVFKIHFNITLLYMLRSLKFFVLTLQISLLKFCMLVISSMHVTCLSHLILPALVSLK